MLKHALPLSEVATTQAEIRQALPDENKLGAISRIFHALSDPTRCKIVLTLTNHELCVTDLAEILGVSISGISHHLKGLRDKRIVKFRREGNTIYYSVDDAHVGNLFQEVMYHLDHVEHNLPDHPTTMRKNVSSPRD
jgi:ArsR family transcriptional regulator, lead/cadmium/zinc/bismuth-responsive transcriptional repressor